MDVAQYITDLLDEKEEVSIPGVGTLYQKSFESTFDQANNAFFPPKKDLSFIAGEGDSIVLAEHISKVKNLTLPSAKYFAEQFGITIQSDLKTHGIADISPLGTLSTHADQYLFTPSDSYVTGEYYGLPPVKELEIREVHTPATPTPQKEIISEENASFVQSIDQYAIQPEEAILVETEVKTRKAWPIILMVLIAIIALGTIGVLNYYPNFFNDLTKKVLPSAQPKKIIPAEKTETTKESLATADSILAAQGFTVKKDSLATKDTILNALQQQGFEVEKVPDTILHITTQTQTITPKETTTYEIIGASLRSLNEAEKYIAQMKAKGIDARIVNDKNGKLIKVSLGSFTDKEKAQTEQKRIQADINANAWILQIKK